MKKIAILVLAILMSCCFVFCVSAKTHKKSFKKLKPIVINRGYHFNGEDVEQDLGAKLKGAKGYKNVRFVYYHKYGKKFYKVGTKKAKGIKSKKLNIEWVETGRIHQYKVRAYIKRGRKKIYSKMSSIKKIFVPRNIAQYKVECLTPAGVYKDRKTLDISFKITSSSKYNGVTIFKNNKLDSFDFEEFRKTNTHALKFYYDNSISLYEVIMKGPDEEEYTSHNYFFGLKSYRFENSGWKTIPENGVKLKSKQTIYLTGTLYNEYDPEEKDIYFGGQSKSCNQSILYFNESVYEYKSPEYGELFAYVNFLDGKGTGYYDND
ncbi:MAG TPA: hypothetical protein DCR28_03140 [Eubacterium sp.]|nr:hypothetical protein [Eubacterium sp.]